MTFIKILIFIATAFATPSGFAEIRPLGINCPAPKAQQIQAFDNQLRRRLNDLLAQWPLFDFQSVKTHFIVPENRQFTEGATINQSYQNYWLTLQRTFARMANDARTGINYICSSSSDRYCQDQQTFAYVPFIGNVPVKKLFLCPILFSSSADHQVEVIFHELSHYSSSSEDFAGDWWSRDSIDLNRASRDAYHIQRFMNSPSEHILRNAIWVWLWKK